MFKPDNPLTPRDDAFDEAWQAQVLAIADNMVQAGLISAGTWAETLGLELRKADAEGKPDTTETYYLAALSALEHLTTSATPLTSDDLSKRKADWTQAYKTTAHGEPVILKNNAE